MSDKSLRIKTIDVHTGGEPLRVLVDGFPDLPGDTILAKRAYAKANHDDLRRALMWEPRGHADMYGCIPVKPVTDDGDIGVLFIHNEGFSTMCGHGIIGITKVALECGLLAASEGENVVRIDTPAGRVTARADVVDGVVGAVTFANVPSFLLESDLIVEVEGVGEVTCDIAFGGAFYAYVDAARLGLTIDGAHSQRLIEVGMAIKRAVMEQWTIEHPDLEPTLLFLYGVVLYEDILDGHLHSRNACVFADGELDRSPTGTGVSGRAAILHYWGELLIGQSIRIASVIGSIFEVKVASLTKAGRTPAIIPEVTGEAFLTGRHEFILDPTDPFRCGFLVR